MGVTREQLRPGWLGVGVIAVSLSLASAGCGGGGHRDAAAPDVGRAGDAPPLDAGDAGTGGDANDDAPTAVAHDAPAGGDAADAPAVGSRDAPAGSDASDGPAADARDAPAGSDVSDGPAADARDAPAGSDASDGPGVDARDAAAGDARDGAGDAPPAGVGACSEARLLEQARTMVEGWRDRMRVCEPQQTLMYSSNNFSGSITRDSCIGTECGAAGKCAVDFDWYSPFVASRDNRGQLSVNTRVHVAPRCTIRYTHGAETCLCHVDPTLTAVWQDKTFRVDLTAASTGDPGPLMFTAGTIQSSGGTFPAYGTEVVTCEGTFIGTDGVDRCTLAPASGNGAMRADALAECESATRSWLITLSAVFRPYVAAFVGSCP
jgi:hypothetical protein